MRRDRRRRIRGRLKLAERSILAFRPHPPLPLPEKPAAIDPYANSTLLPDVSQPFDVSLIAPDDDVELRLRTVEFCLKTLRDQGLDSAGLDVSDAAVERQRRADEAKRRESEKPTVATHVQNELSPDGPEPPDGFTYKGKTYSGLTAKPFMAVSFLWERRNKTASGDELAEPVWRDHAFNPDDVAIQGLRKEINRFFRKSGIPWHAMVKTAHLCLREGPPREGRTKVSRKQTQSRTRRCSRR